MKNGIIKKIAGLSLGIAMAIGVGVAAGHKGVAREAKAETVAAKDYYVKVTSASALADGDKVIWVNQAGTAAAKANGGDNNPQLAISTTNGEYNPSAAADVCVFTIKKDGNNYGFHTGTGYIYSKGSSNNKIGVNTTAASTAPSGTSAWTIKITSGVCTIKNVTNTAKQLQYNSSNTMFSQYSNTQADFCLYKKTEKADDWTYKSIALSTTEGFKSEYYLGEEFDKTGIVVQYTEHSDTLGEDRITNVVDLATFNFDSSSLGTFKLIATYETHSTNDNVSITIVREPIDYSSVNFGGFGERVEDVSNLSSGMHLVLANKANEALAGYLSGTYLAAMDAENCFAIKNEKETVQIGDGSYDTKVMVFILGGNSTDGWTLQNKAGKYLTESAEKSVTFADDAATWTISISSGNATIRSTNRLQYNSNNPRFTTYSSNQSAVQIYSFTEYMDEATTYAAAFNAAKVCGDTNTTQAIKSVWDAQATAFASLSSQAKNILKNASGNAEAAEAIPQCLARYDRVMSLKLAGFVHYADFENFMERLVAPLDGSNIKIENFKENHSSYVTIIIVAISATSILALGALLLLKKKKEN